MPAVPISGPIASQAKVLRHPKASSRTGMRYSDTTVSANPVETFGVFWESGSDQASEDVITTLHGSHRLALIDTPPAATPPLRTPAPINSTWAVTAVPT